MNIGYGVPDPNQMGVATIFQQTKQAQVYLPGSSAHGISASRALQYAEQEIPVVGIACVCAITVNHGVGHMPDLYSVRLSAQYCFVYPRYWNRIRTQARNGGRGIVHYTQYFASMR